MAGTPKQVAWADDLRGSVQATYNAAVELSGKDTLDRAEKDKLKYWIQHLAYTTGQREKFTDNAINGIRVSPKPTYTVRSKYFGDSKIYSYSSILRDAKKALKSQSGAKFWIDNRANRW